MAGVEGEGVGKKQAREQGERDGRSTAFPTPLYTEPFPPLLQPATQANLSGKLNNKKNRFCNLNITEIMCIKGFTVESRYIPFINTVDQPLMDPLVTPQLTLNQRSIVLLVVSQQFFRLMHMSQWTLS